MEEQAPVRFDVVNIEDILKTLPHRYPMLLIDRVINIRADYSGIGIKNVTFNEPCFLGHFPDRPVYPGVMMIEAMAQTAGVIGIKSVEGTHSPQRALGRSFRQADQAMVPRDRGRRAPGARRRVRSEGRGAGVMEEQAPVRFDVVNIEDILKTLPHRYPMLLIDRVINIRSDYSGIGIKNVTFNEPCFLGHFPDRPVYPGVMMIEAMAQTAGVIGIKSVEGTEKPRAVYFLTIDKCKFRKPVMPGDTIEYHMRSIGRRKTMWWFHGDAKVNGQVVAEADVGAMLTD